MGSSRGQHFREGPGLTAVAERKTRVRNRGCHSRLLLTFLHGRLGQLCEPRWYVVVNELAAQVLTSVGTDWANAEVRSYTISHDDREGPVLCETIESRMRRGVDLVPLTREEQLALRQNAMRAAIEWGLIRP
jgi:hypothetical protein